MARSLFARLTLVATVVLALSVPGLAAEDSVLSVLEKLPNARFAYIAFKNSEIASDLSDPSLIATVFVPTDEAFVAGAASLGEASASALATGGSAALSEALGYSVVPGEAFTTDELEAGIVLHTLVDGALLRVAGGEGTHASLLTSSGQRVPILGQSVPAGGAVVQLVGAVLVPNASLLEPATDVTISVASVPAAEEDEFTVASIDVDTYYAPAPEVDAY